MTPQSWQDWIAWAGVVIPAFVLAYSAVQHVNNEAGRQSRERALRLQELAKIVRARDTGISEHLLAIHELGSFRKERKVVLKLAEIFRGEYVSRGDHAAYIEAVDEMIRALKK